MSRYSPRTSLRCLACAGAALAVAWPAGAQDTPAAGSGTQLGAPAIDFSTGGAGPGEAQIYIWVDGAGVTHFTDDPGDYLARFRDRFQPVSLFVNPSGQPKR